LPIDYSFIHWRISFHFYFQKRGGKKRTFEEIQLFITLVFTPHENNRTNTDETHILSTFSTFSTEISNTP